MRPFAGTLLAALAAALAAAWRSSSPLPAAGPASSTPDSKIVQALHLKRAGGGLRDRAAIHSAPSIELLNDADEVEGASDDAGPRLPDREPERRGRGPGAPPLRPGLHAEGQGRPEAPGAEIDDADRGAARLIRMATKREPRLISLGYGKFARADRVYALVPLEPGERGEGRRTYVHVDGLSEPLVASRSEKAILADIEAALTEAAGIPRRRRTAKGQESLL